MSHSVFSSLIAQVAGAAEARASDQALRGPAAFEPSGVPVPRVQHTRGLSERTLEIHANILQHLAGLGRAGASQAQIEAACRLNRSQGYRPLVVLCQAGQVERFTGPGIVRREPIAMYRLTGLPEEAEDGS